MKQRGRAPKPREATPPPTMSKDALAVQKRFREALLSRLQFAAEMRARVLKDFSRRANLVGTFQEELLRAGLEKLGTSAEEIRARQDNDIKLARKQARARRKELLERSAIAAKDHDSKRRRRQAVRGRFEKTVGNPRLSVFLCQCANQPYWGVPGGTVSGGPSLTGPQYVNAAGKNVTRWRLGLDGTGGGFKTYVAFLATDFVWQSDREGVLSAEAIYYLNGTYSLDLPGMCIGHAEASLRVSPLLLVAQNVVGTTDVVLGSTDSLSHVLDLRTSAGCSGVTDDGLIETGEQSLSRANFPLQANKPLIVSVGLVVEAYAYNGASLDLDFFSEASFAWDVPCVALVIDS
jgi:hypothetical protein